MTTPSPAPAGVKRKACLQCTKSKRKCDKQTPVCQRCVEKTLSCKYPTKRVVVSYDEDTTRPFHDIHDERNWVSRQNSPSSYSSNLLQSDAFSNAWFLSPDTWNLDHGLVIDQPRAYGEDTLYDYISEITSWLRRWVVEGSSPLLHAQLYRAELPVAIEDAYTSVTAFLATNEINKLMTMRILGHRVQQLVSSQPDALDSSMSMVTVNTVAHLARTQALFIYQLIRLFDGDIRSRAQAEVHSELLLRWAKQMWESASIDISMIRLSSTLQEADSVGYGLDNAFRTDGTPESLWRAWIVGESIRRTYLLSVCMLSVYSTLKQGWSPCPGGLTITSRKGLWNATSPYKCLKASRFCRDTTIESLQCGQLFQDASPSEVDDFTTAVLLVSHGKERLEQWAVESETHAV